MSQRLYGKLIVNVTINIKLLKMFMIIYILSMIIIYIRITISVDSIQKILV